MEPRYGDDCVSLDGEMEEELVGLESDAASSILSQKWTWKFKELGIRTSASDLHDVGIDPGTKQARHGSRSIGTSKHIWILLGGWNGLEVYREVMEENDL